MYKDDVKRAMIYLDRMNENVCVKLVDDDYDTIESGSVKEIKEFLAEDASDTGFICCLDREAEIDRIERIVRTAKRSELFRAVFLTGSDIKNAEEWAQDGEVRDLMNDDELVCGGHVDYYLGFGQDTLTKSEALDRLEEAVNAVSRSFNYSAPADTRKEDENANLLDGLWLAVTYAAEAGLPIVVDFEKFCTYEQYYFDFPGAIEDDGMRERVENNEIDFSDFCDEFDQNRVEITEELDNVREFIKENRTAIQG